ncbi:uncharacterized protein EDB91DRAFT_211185 [Suillus paluster]|uniref:uncharacterized protein n=1 Tax=Suillus paluster TaxID=48578 RepID=UPI001B86629F|nr:uncharacterized protein EDB91DRAFT_211185 [Suillus paluster]KAG1744127.1 hypothetical protein EDB91DRAFT_211185 [Suillus paluster]
MPTSPSTDLKDACTDKLSLAVWAQGVEVPTVFNTTGNKRLAGTAVDMPPSKRIKTDEVRKEERPDTMIETSKPVWKNSHLPPGCLDSNTWRGVFIPTIAYAAGGENIDPWYIDNNMLVRILMKAWKVVYGKLSSTDNPIYISSPVYDVSKQRLDEWRSGFGSAAIMMITSLIASKSITAAYERQSEFARHWLYGNRFLFENASSNDKKEWTGMWQSTFILETFSAHLVYTQGRVPVDELRSEEQLCRTALALSAAAVKRTFNLLSTGKMSFEIRTRTAVAKGKKNAAQKSDVPASNGDLWEASISNDETFSEQLWGYDSRMFLKAIMCVPAENMLEIIENAKPFMKAAARGGGSETDSVPEDKDFVDLFDFR